MIDRGAAWILVTFSLALTSYFHTVALKKNGTLWAWKSNQDGQLGNATHTDSLRPVQVFK